MVIVAGHLIVDHARRESYLADCVSVIEQARRAPGCLDFSISADLVVPGRINILNGGSLRQTSRRSAATAPARSRTQRCYRRRCRSTTSRTYGL